MIRRMLAAAIVLPLALVPAAAQAVPEASAMPSKTSHKSCTTANLLRALPEGAHMKKYTCATDDGGTKWAAVLLKEGPTLYFEKYLPKKNKWDVYLDTDICGAASAGLPVKILNYCKYSS